MLFANHGDVLRSPTSIEDLAGVRRSGVLVCYTLKRCAATHKPYYAYEGVVEVVVTHHVLGD